MFVIPRVLLHVTKQDNQHEDEVVETFADIRAGYLKTQALSNSSYKKCFKKVGNKVKLNQ